MTPPQLTPCPRCGQSVRLSPKAAKISNHHDLCAVGHTVLEVEGAAELERAKLAWMRAA